MEITQKDWNNYIEQLSAIDKTSASLIEEYIREFGVEDRDALIRFANQIVMTFANSSAAVAADWYDAIAELQNVVVAPAEMAAIPTYGDVAKTVNGVLKRTRDAAAIGSAAANLVKRTGADTTLHNAMRDGAEFAWIPHGDTCPFCLQIASYGWRPASKRTIKGNHADHIHANCDCEFAIRFGDDLKYASYHPEQYAEMFENAEGATDADKRNYIRRMQYQDPAIRDRINEQKRARYAEKRAVAINGNNVVEYKVAGRDAVRNTFTEVYYNQENDYSIHLDGYSDRVNEALSKAARQVAEDGSKTRNEHLHLIDLERGVDVFQDEGDHTSVGGAQFWDFLDEHKDGRYAFVHNHNTDGMFSETDMGTLLRTDQIPIMIAVRNDGVKYVAIRKGDTIGNVLFDDLYPDDIEAINKLIREGAITPAERTLLREEKLVFNLLRDYTEGGGLVEYDGRAN